ncbi:sodium channel protein Nach [Musca vetustissima]|uniref:sodium channel protein Nach n=1 Tax=Musca vetustissima TaxID=27455 RepID=UPI002AB7E7DE|nr:sodium channel protein Nach [Musca vetustissima]
MKLRFIRNKSEFLVFWKRFRLAMADTFLEYAMRTKVSGIWLLRPSKTHRVTKCIWSSVLLSLFSLAVFLSLQLWLKFYSYPILNTIANDVSITDVPFPGVTVCSPKVINVDRVKRFINKLNIPPGYDVKKIAEGFDYLNAFTDQTWLPTNSSSFNETYQILLLNNITTYEAAVAVSAGCDDFVRRCFWGNEEFECRQNHEYLSFSPTTSYLGPCCSFNFHPQNESYVPFSSNTFGIDGGLSFIGVEGSETDTSTGLIVLVHHPMDFATEAASSVTITTNSESFIEISPTVQAASTEVIELPAKKRDCLTSDEMLGNIYRQAACILKCESETILQKCQCNPYHLPKFATDKRMCMLNDSECYSRNFDNFKSVRCENCLPNCHDVTYNTLAYKTDILLHNYSVNHFHKNLDYSTDMFIVHIFLSRQVVPSIHKVTVMSWIGLLSDLGGVFNLCLGLSMISVVEFIYYCTYRLKVNYKMRSVLMQT